MNHFAGANNMVNHFTDDGKMVLAQVRQEMDGY